MALVTPEGYGLAAWHFSVPGQSGDVVVTCGYFNFLEVTASEAAQSLYDDFDNNALDFLSAELGLLAVTVSQNEGGAFNTTGEFVQGDPGGKTGDCMPPNCSILVRKVTAEGGRIGRGRFYFPGIPKEDVTNAGLYEDTPRADFQAGLTDFLDATESSGLSLVVLHDDGGAGAAVDPYFITSLSVQTKLATQRTRLRD